MREVLRLFRDERGELEAKALHLHSPLLLYCLPLHFRAAPLSSIAAAVASTALHLSLFLSVSITNQPSLGTIFREWDYLYTERKRRGRVEPCGSHFIISWCFLVLKKKKNIGCVFTCRVELT